MSCTNFELLPSGRLLRGCVLTFLLCLPLPLGAGEAPGPVGPGILEPRLRTVFSAEYAMSVARVFLRPGDAFAAGDVLVEFDAVLARANHEAAVADERVARMHLESMGELAASRQITALELETAKRDSAAARARRAAAEKELAATVLKAPFSGRVAEVHAHDHEWVGRGAPLLTVVDDTALRVRFILPETSFPLAKIGTSLPLSIPAVGGGDRAIIGAIGAVFESASRTFDVWADLDNAAGRYRAGMTVEVDLSGMLAAPERGGR